MDISKAIAELDARCEKARAEGTSRAMLLLIRDLEAVAGGAHANDLPAPGAVVSVGAHACQLIKNARANMYDDFRCPDEVTAPIGTLVQHATAGGPAFAGIVSNAKDGKYDSAL